MTTTIVHDDEQIIAWAADALRVEGDAVHAIIPRLNSNFAAVVKRLASCTGKVVFTGMGKAGIIAQKSSATLASTGTPSVWLHLAEAVHGDLGRVERQDVAVILSYSGETDELRTVVPILKLIGASIVAITGNMRSYLAQYADYALDIAVSHEVCLGLAPTTSTTAMLALCDAIAVALQELKGFKPRDFARFHPKGSLGRRLLFRVADCMRRGERNPIASPETLVAEVLMTITRGRAGACTLVHGDGRVAGIFTDGDLRRHLERDADLLRRAVGEVMTVSPITTGPDVLAAEAAHILQERQIDEMPVVDEHNRVIGLIDVQDLLSIGIL